MCLDTLDKKTRKRGGFGYKLLSKCDGEPHTFIQKFVALPIGKWVSDPSSETRYVEYSYPNQYYPTGFHIFSTLEDLKRWRGSSWYNLSIFRVQFKEVIASGYQYKCRTIVARKVKVIEEVV